MLFSSFHTLGVDAPSDACPATAAGARATVAGATPDEATRRCNTIGAMRANPARLLVAGALSGAVLAAAFAGGSSAAVSKRLPFKAVLKAPTHHPVVNKPWPISIRVTNLKGKPIAASVHMQVLFNGLVVGQIDEVKTGGPGRVYKFVGTWREKKGDEITWPIDSVGYRLTFQAVVTAKGATKKLNWWIQVVKK
jgi:hypothetical protein